MNSFIDARSLPSGTAIETDLLIVGGGPAGITLASVHWRTIEPSRDPLDFRTFLEVQQDSAFAPLAERRLAALETEGRGLIAAVSARAGADLPAAEGGARGLVTDCDLAVSDDEDFARLAAPVPWGLVNTRLALRVCAVDLARGIPLLAGFVGDVALAEFLHDVAERFVVLVVDVALHCEPTPFACGWWFTAAGDGRVALRAPRKDR